MVAVTTLLKLLDKPALLNWANRIGLDGISLKEYRSKSTKKGTLKHKQIEEYLNHGVLFDESDRLDECLKGFEIVGIEGSVDNGFVSGRYDLFIKDDKKSVVVDFKSSNKIYLEQKIQLSTYKELLKADSVAVINFNTWELNILDIDTEKYYKILKHLYFIYRLKIELNEL